ncbi:PEGA domain protein [Spirochaeta thermophila DSM 6578]|uniref:PEGA domain protein n=1 Tax=Winmispira thermophila (strain ATCC 700085 / DSM 6578 / Z-1203) TaxID=869211 RepID=G0GD53_WINT7|nr:PEGA domain-containing protein [Spirochaeta thermophila]AEJ62128.1 PEGA domain protein [Spirochaeta thermophila DSM 6578]
MRLRNPLIPLLLLVATALSPAPVTIAVLPVEGIGVPEEQAAAVTDLLYTTLTAVPLFQVVERARLEEVLTEQEIQVSGLTGAQQAVRIGNLTNARKVLIASLAAYKTAYVESILSARVVDVEKGTVEAAASVELSPTTSVEEAAKTLVRRLVEAIPLSVTVAAVEGRTVYLSAGEQAGLVPGRIVTAVKTRPITDETGAIVMREERPYARLQVEEVQPTGARALLVEAEEELQVGDTVVLEDSPLAEGAPRLVVKSIPEGAMVYIDGTFSGKTPLTLEGLSLGTHQVEIRAPGYKPYAGKVRLAEGQQAVIERELVAEVQVEDLLRIGKLPREKTDPSTALTRGIVPGGGLVYDGYTNLGLMAGGATLIQAAISGIFLSNLLDDETPPDHEPYNLISGITLGASALTLYLYSLIDGMLTADDDYLYPTYAELVLSGEGHHVFQTQTADPDSTQAFNQAVADGISNTSWFFVTALRFRAPRYQFGLEIDASQEEVMMGLSSAYLLPLSEHLSLGAQVAFKGNFTDPSDVDLSQTAPSELAPSPPGGITAVGALLALSSPHVELDLFLSPYAVGTCYGVFHNPSWGTWTYNETRFLPYGYGGSAGLSLFPSLRAGIHLWAEGYSFHRTDETPVENSETPSYVDNLRFIRGGIGLVYRFM